MYRYRTKLTASRGRQPLGPLVWAYEDLLANDANRCGSSLRQDPRRQMHINESSRAVSSEVLLTAFKVLA